MILIRQFSKVHIRKSVWEQDKGAPTSSGQVRMCAVCNTQSLVTCLFAQVPSERELGGGIPSNRALNPACGFIKVCCLQHIFFPHLISFQTFLQCFSGSQKGVNLFYLLTSSEVFLLWFSTQIFLSPGISQSDCSQCISKMLSNLNCSWATLVDASC